MNGFFYILRTVAPWRDLPERYGPHRTVYNRYVRWGERGVWRGIFEALATECEDALVLSTGPSSRRSGRKWGELRQGIGRSCGPLIDWPAIDCWQRDRGSKVHAAVDDPGRPLRIDVTGADSKAFDAFLDRDAPPPTRPRAAPRSIADEGAVAVIPSKSNAKVPIPHDTNLSAMRNLVERFFCRMKDMRRLTTRYEKLKKNFMSMLHIFAIR